LFCKDLQGLAGFFEIKVLPFKFLELLAIIAVGNRGPLLLMGQNQFMELPLLQVPILN